MTVEIILQTIEYLESFIGTKPPFFLLVDLIGWIEDYILNDFSFMRYILVYLLLSPLGGLYYIYKKVPRWFEEENYKVNKDYVLDVRNRVFLSTIFTFALSLLLIVFYNPTEFGYQYYLDFKFLTLKDSQMIFDCAIGVDGISILFIILTTLLIPICLLASWSVDKFTFQYFSLFLIIEFLLILVFSVLNIFHFYIFFEAVLIPMFLLIGFWGSRERRIKASYYFFLYTLFGSLFMFLALISMYLEAGTLDFIKLAMHQFSFDRQKVLWLAFFIAFAVKIPMFPLHIWLPEAHVEAPTAGSVLLAGLMLKLGGYGFLRFTIPIFPLATEYYLPLIYTLCILGISYASMTTLRQIDLKRIIAYSSVAHMNFVLLGIFSCTYEGIEGAILLMLGHGFVSSALFLLVGVLYNRYKSRLLFYYGGITQVMPVFSTFFLFFSLANLSFPGTSNFVGEFLILLGLVQKSTVILLLAGFGMVLSAAYSIWLYNRVAFGELNITYLKKFSDMDDAEFNILTPLVFLTLLMGIYPKFFLYLIHYSVLGNLRIC